MDYTVHGILQARILEWVAFPFSRWSPNPGIEPRSAALQTDSLPAEPQGILAYKSIVFILCMKMTNPHTVTRFPSLFVTLFLIYLQALSQ